MLPVGLVALFAKRVATPAAAALVVAVTFVARDAQAAWTLSCLMIAVLASARAASFPDAWLTGEGDWLGTAAAERSSLALATWIGSALGATLLTAVAGISIAAQGSTQPGSDGPLLETSAVAGPASSLVLMPSESFEQPLGDSAGAAFPRGSMVHIRATVTVGGSAPTTSAHVAAGPASESTMVARRTWLKVDLPPGARSILVTNTGEGALALLGPRPFEILSPSRAWSRGHLRMWAHVSVWLIALVSLSLMWGVVMGPGVAALFALSLWLGAWMWLAGGTGTGGAWLPGGTTLHQALGALGNGQSPLPPPATTVGAALATLVASTVIGTALLRTWRDEVRG